MYFRHSFLRKYTNKLISFRCYCVNVEIEKLTHACEPRVFSEPPFSNYTELAELLKKNVIYCQNGLLIVNRPYGLKRTEPNERKAGEKTRVIPMIPCSEHLNHLTFSGVLERLSTELRTPQLSLLKAPDRYSSGISILHYNDHVENRIRKAFLPTHVPICTYLAVCIGLPSKPADSTKLGVTLKQQGQFSKVIFLTNYSKRSINMQKVFPFVVHHKVLSVQEKLDVSLVELQINRTKWNSLRAYCAMRLLTPILGDYIYGSCAKIMQGVRIPVDPFSPGASLPVKIPREVYSALELHPKQRSILPLHLHFAQLDLTKCKTFRRTVVARPSDHFLWTCEKLGLRVPQNYMTNHTTPEQPNAVPYVLANTREKVSEIPEHENESVVRD